MPSRTDDARARRRGASLPQNGCQSLTANPRRRRPTGGGLGIALAPVAPLRRPRSRAAVPCNKRPFTLPHHVDAQLTIQSPADKLSKTIKMQFAKVLVALAAGAAAFTAPTASKVSKVVVRGENPNEDGKLGAGGMADTRDPEPFVNETDKRQSISQAPSFEEYLKSRQ